MIKRILVLGCLIAAFVLLYSFSQAQNQFANAQSSQPATAAAVPASQPTTREVTQSLVVLRPTKGNTAAGWMKFWHGKDGCMVEAVLTGLTPGEHGFHFHELGDCTGDDGKTASKHFGPLNVALGESDSNKELHNKWKLGILQADKDGNAKLTKTLDGSFSFEGDGSILGRSVIVHAEVGGPRVACGVIGVSKVE